MTEFVSFSRLPLRTLTVYRPRCIKTDSGVSMLIKNEGPGYFMCNFPLVYKNSTQLIIGEKVNHIFHS